MALTPQHLEKFQDRVLSCLNKIQETIAAKPEEDSLDPILFCTVVDENCVLTGAQALIRDEETGELTRVYFDANFNPTNIPPEGEPCDTACGDDYDIKILPSVCYEDANDNKWQLTVCLQFQNGVQINQTEIWLSPTGEVFDANPGGLTPCDVDCNPAIADVTVSEGGYIPFTQGNVSTLKPCCEVEVVTNVGTFYLRQGMQQKNIGPFGCPIEILSVTVNGDCAENEVFIHMEDKGCTSCNL